MNRFRKLGFIHYAVGDNLEVHSSLLSVVLNDDNGTPMTPDVKNSKAYSNKGLEPPAKRGGPAERDRARMPPLLGLKQR
jgi:hypothetical protein